MGRSIDRSIDGSINHVDGNACTLTLPSFSPPLLGSRRARGCNVHEESGGGGERERGFEDAHTY